MFETIQEQFNEMYSLLEKWSNINSSSYNSEGLERLLSEINNSFSILGGKERIIDGTLFIEKRADADHLILLGGHYDTVYSKDSPFQKVLRKGDHLIGPGVTDMKGGLIVMLKALEAFESSEYSKYLGWKVFINPDEEIGSTHSIGHIEEFAKGCGAALLFEPTTEEGKFISARKGSANYRMDVKGKAAHAGRDFHKGESAVYKLAEMIVKLKTLISEETIINVGTISGGETSNTVPDQACCTVNVRSYDIEKVESKIREVTLGAEVTLLSKRPPKPLTKETESLFSLLKECGMAIKFEETGGVCDGNFIQSFGIPTIDTMGVQGGKIHTEEEFLLLPSLVERAQLTARFLTKYAKRVQDEK